MRLVIKIDMDNAAFDDSIPDELTEIFRNIVESVACNGVGSLRDEPRPIFDSNGNKVGSCEVKGK